MKWIYISMLILKDQNEVKQIIHIKLFLSLNISFYELRMKIAVFCNGFIHFYKFKNVNLMKLSLIKSVFFMPLMIGECFKLWHRCTLPKNSMLIPHHFQSSIVTIGHILRANSNPISLKARYYLKIFGNDTSRINVENANFF